MLQGGGGIKAWEGLRHFLIFAEQNFFIGLLRLILTFLAFGPLFRDLGPRHFASYAWKFQIQPTLTGWMNLKTLEGLKINFAIILSLNLDSVQYKALKLKSKL